MVGGGTQEIHNLERILQNSSVVEINDTLLIQW